jgi:hypothetical protein
VLKRIAAMRLMAAMSGSSMVSQPATAVRTFVSQTGIA